MTTVSQLLCARCATCRKGLLPGTPSALGAVTLSAARQVHVCGDCVGKGKAILGGLAAVTGRVLEKQQPELFGLAKDFYVGLRAAKLSSSGAR